MILIDFSQLAIAAAWQAQSAAKKNRGIIDFDGKMTVPFLRHVIINSLRHNFVKFKHEFGKEMVVCFDAPRSWRKDYFPYYKANRKKDRDESDFDWAGYFEALKVLKPEFIENLPFKFLEVERAEADDLIGILTAMKGSTGEAFEFGEDPENIVIVSSDKDFRQLQVFNNVKQWSPMFDKWVVESSPTSYRREHILTGDQGDGIPNVLSDDDTFVNPDKRQKPLTKKRIGELEDTPRANWAAGIGARYDRNKILVDLIDGIPHDLRAQVEAAYKNLTPGRGSKLYTYLTRNNLTNLASSAQDFI